LAISTALLKTKGVFHLAYFLDADVLQHPRANVFLVKNRVGFDESTKRTEQKFRLTPACAIFGPPLALSIS
jgi:hypothetical protein